jgi:hypothetical protein
MHGKSTLLEVEVEKILRELDVLGVARGNVRGTCRIIAYGTQNRSFVYCHVVCWFALALALGGGQSIIHVMMWTDCVFMGRVCFVMDLVYGRNGVTSFQGMDL